MHPKKRIPRRLLAILLSLVLVLILLPATAAAQTTSQIGFTSDVHGKVTDLTTWLDKLNDSTPTLNHFIFGGDFDYTPANVYSTANTAVSKVETAFPGVSIFTAKGNHDGDAGEARFSNVGTSPLVSGSNIGYNQGLVYNGDDYAVYVMNCNMASSYVQYFSQTDIDNLPGVLSSVGLSKPIFIISHFPIHYLTNSRMTQNAEELFNILKDYSNVVFLWGHNHSQTNPAEPDYGNVRTAAAGDTIQFTSAATNKQVLTFTYASLGAMYSGNNSAYGLLATIDTYTNSSTVTLEYKDLSGSTVSIGSVTISSSDEISNVAVTGIDTPVAGNTPDTSAVASAGVISPVTVCWYEGETPFTGTFTTGATYTASMTLEPAGSKTFAAGTSVTVNGNTAAAPVPNGDGTLTVTYNFTAQEPAVAYTKAATLNDGHEYAVVMSGKAMNNSAKTGTYNSTAYTGLGYVAPIISGDKNTLTFASPADAAASTWTFTSAGTAGQWYISNQGSNVYAAAARALGLDGTDKTAWTCGTLSGKTQLYATLPDGESDATCKIYYGYAGTVATVDFFYPTKNNDGDLTFYEKNGTIADPEPESTIYKEVSDLTAGGSYIIVANDGTADYAVKFQTTEDENYSVGSAAVTITDGAGYMENGASLAETDIITAADDTLLWTYNSAQQFNSAADSDYCLYGGRIDPATGKSSSSAALGLFAVTLERDTIYDPGIQKMYAVGNQNDVYFTIDNGTFSGAAGVDNGCIIRLFKEVHGGAEGPPAADTPLDSVAVTGIDTPIAGGTPDTSAAVDAGAVSSITWNPAVSGMFAGHTAYTVSVTLQAPGGYDFTAATTATLNGCPVAPVLNGDGTLTVSYTFAKTGAAPVVTYERVTSFTPGEAYVIVSDKGGTTRALQNIVEDEDYLAGAEVTVSDDMIVGGVDGSMLWTAESGSTGTYLVHSNQYLTRGSKASSGSYYLITGSAPEDPYSDWFYNSADKSLYIKSSTDYYLYWSSGGYFRMSTSTGSGEIVYLYKQIITVPTPECIEAVFTQDGLVVYPGTSLDELKANLIVNVVYSDGSTAQLADGDYTLSGTLAVGESIVTVAYGEKTAAFTVTVTKNMTAALNAVIQGTTIIGNPVSGIVAQFPAVIPEDVISAGYKINSVITLGAPLPADARLTITLNGLPYLTDYDLKGKTSFKITDLFTGAVPAPFNAVYNNRTETYRLAITGTATPVNTVLTLKSIISNDDFATFVVLESKPFNLVTHTVSFTAGAHGRLTGTTCFTALNGTAWSAAIPILPATVADRGYNFAGWSQAFPDSITNPAAFTANFTENIYHITYILGGGTNNGANPAEYAFGSTVTLTSPSRAGYTFGGWFRDAGFTAAAAGISAEDSGDKTFYAKWTPSGGGGDTPPAGGSGGGGSTPPAGGSGGSGGGGGGTVLGTSSKAFNDVKESDWYYEAVQFVVSKGLFGGTSDQLFEPDTPMSRAMLAAVLYRNEGNPAVSAPNPFKDVPAGAWYSGAVLWANQNGIAAGYSDDTFRPDQSLTRAQLADFLYNYAKYKGYDLTQGKGFNLQLFKDAYKITEYFIEAMKWACGAGLIKGIPGDLLAPADNASRAEVATILKRFSEKFED